jgi:hypothetical protein
MDLPVAAPTQGDQILPSIIAQPATWLDVMNF